MDVLNSTMARLAALAALLLLAACAAPRSQDKGNSGKGGTGKYRTVLTWKSDDTFTYEMFDTVDGKEIKGMELTYTRKK